MAHKREERKFETSKLMLMQEPLVLRVEKVKGNSKQPIELPSGTDGTPPGTNLTRDDILKAESFVLDWAGGGFYSATVTDVNGLSMSWDFGWNPQQFPEKIPPTAQAAASPQALASAGGGTQPSTSMGQSLGQIAATPRVPNMSGSAPLGQATSWPPPAGSFLSNYQPPAYVPPSSPPPPSPLWQGFPGHHGSTDAENRVRAAELRSSQLERDMLEQRYQGEIDKQRVANEQAMAALREEMRRMGEAQAQRGSSTETAEVKELRERLATAERQREADRITGLETTLRQQMQDLATKLVEKKPDDEIRILRDEMLRRDEALKVAREQERLEREKDRADERHRQEMLAMQAKMDSMILQLSQPKSDPMVEFMKENARNQQETLKEVARSQQAQMEKITAFMINPMQLAALMKDTSSGSESMLRTITTGFGEAFGTYRTALESIAQLTNGPAVNPAVEIIQNALSKGSEIAQNWIEGKKIEAESDARKAASAAQIARARAQAMGGSQAVPVPVVPANGHGNGTVHTPGPGPAGAGLSGAVIPGPGAPGGPAPARSAPSDQQLFGGMLAPVQSLREAVKNGATSPAVAASGVLTGIGRAQQEAKRLNVPLGHLIPAFTVYEQGKLDVLFDMLLPDASDDYRAECVNIMAAKLGLNASDDDAPSAATGDEQAPA